MIQEIDYLALEMTTVSRGYVNEDFLSVVRFPCETFKKASSCRTCAFFFERAED